MMIGTRNAIGHAISFSSSLQFRGKSGGFRMDASFSIKAVGTRRSQSNGIVEVYGPAKGQNLI